MAQVYATCDSANVDSSGVCSAVTWVAPPSAFPALSLSDAATIGMAIVGCWLVGYAWRVIADALDNDEPLTNPEFN